MLSVMGAFAQFERAVIRERKREGVELAKARGVYRERRRCLSANHAAELLRWTGAGVPKAVPARELGVSRETLYQALRATSVRSEPCRFQGLPVRRPKRPYTAPLRECNPGGSCGTAPVGSPSERGRARTPLVSRSSPPIAPVTTG